MKLVIEIPEEFYEAVKKDPSILAPPFLSCEKVGKIIANGVPLPKEHGRLKDVDAFLSKVKTDREHSAYLRSWTADDVLNALDKTYALTVIEAEFPLTDIERSYLTTVQNDINRKRRLAESKKAYGKHVGE